MGRRNIGSPRLLALLDSDGYNHAVLVDGHRNQTATRACENATRQPVPGFLNPDSGCIAKENTRRDFKGLLGTSNHHDLARIAADRSRGSQVVANNLTATFGTPRIGVVYRP